MKLAKGKMSRGRGDGRADGGGWGGETLGPGGFVECEICVYARQMMRGLRFVVRIAPFGYVFR